MGGDVYRLTDQRRSRISIYYVFADAFGWTKKEVDEQPLSHLKAILAMMREERDKEARSLTQQSRKKSF
jgi:hypothetical protein